MLALVQNVLLYVVPFLFVLTLVVTIHELGHFAMARALGVAVDRFAIGFGKAIFSWTDKSGVEWRFGWIPLGGYVRFAGDAEASSTVPDANDLADLKARIRAREGVGGERRYFHFKPVWARSLVVLAGPLANFLLAIVLFAFLLGTYGEIVIRPRVSQVEPGSAAQKAGFMTGDVVRTVDGRPIEDFNQIRNFVMFRAGEPIVFTVERGGHEIALTATPVRQPQTDRLGFTTSVGTLGLRNMTRREDISVRHYTPVEAVEGGVRRTGETLSTTLLYLGRLVRGLESGDQLGGPLRIGAFSGKIAQAGAEGATDFGGQVTGGLMALLYLAAALSVGIGFMNLLPVPVLDGGHLLFYVYEALARRPLGAKVQAAGYRVGLALLLGLMLFATWNDLQQLRVFKLLGGLFS